MMQVNVQDTASSAAQDRGAAPENDKPPAEPARFNAPATRTYLQSLNQQHDNLTEDLQKTMRFLSNSLNGYLQNPREAGDGGGGSGSGSYVKLSSQVISRDARLQERVAQNLSTPQNLVPARDAASSLEQSMEHLAPALKDGTQAGQNLSRFVCQSLVTLTSRQAMGAGLERDLAQHDIYVPPSEPSARTVAATSQALSSTLSYIKANHGEALKNLPADSTPPSADPQRSQNTGTTSYQHQDTQRPATDTTYLDIFRQHRSQAPSQEAQTEERLPEQATSRVRSLIERAADTARRANLFPDQERPAARSQPAAASPAPAGTPAPGSTAADQQPSLSELSARAARLQQQFREERQRLAAESTSPRTAAADGRPSLPAGSLSGAMVSHGQPSQFTAASMPSTAVPGGQIHEGEPNLSSMQTGYSAMQSSLYGRSAQYRSQAVNYEPVQDMLAAQSGPEGAARAPSAAASGPYMQSGMVSPQAASGAPAPSATPEAPPNLQNMFVSAANTMHQTEGNTASSFAQNSLQNLYTNLQANRTAAGSGTPQATLTAQSGAEGAARAPAAAAPGPAMQSGTASPQAASGAPAPAAAAAHASGLTAQPLPDMPQMPLNPGQAASASQRIEPTLDTIANTGTIPLQGTQAAPGITAAAQPQADPAAQPQAGAEPAQPAGQSFFRRVFSMFSGAERPQPPQPAQGQMMTAAPAAPEAAQPQPLNAPSAAAPPAPGSAAEAAAASVPLSAHPLDDLMSRLKTQAQGAALPPEMKAQALKLIRALENPVADLTTVNQWLSFVTGPMNPGSPQAIALHQWAFMLLIIRFRQLGKSAQEFLARSGKLDLGEQQIEQLMPQNMTNREQRASKSLLDDTMAQIQRLQRIHDDTPEHQILPRYVPLPPNYDGGREGGFTIREEQDGTQRTWHLSFFFDIKTLGPIEIRAAATPPELQLAFTAETGEGQRKIQELLPQLRAKLQEFGITTRSSTVHLGVVRHPNAGGAPPPERRRDDGSSLSIDI